MDTTILVADAFFDGRKLHKGGPYSIIIRSGVIAGIEPGDVSSLVPDAVSAGAPFVMPGLVEAHAHLFLDGPELDQSVRKEYLGAPIDRMLEMARKNCTLYRDAGITLVRDAGDAYGVNTRLQAEFAQFPETPVQVRVPGRALRKKGRYGSFLGVEVTDAAGIVAAIHEVASTAQDLKIVLTGIIDFEKCEVKGVPQFDLDECRLMVKTAHELGLPTFAHCSGFEGLRLAVEAGIDSIEHGFFMTREILTAMADRNIAWVPTVSPVHFQYARPELAGWNGTTVKGLEKILDNHFEHIAMALDLGVGLVAGSDAGSFGVRHGSGLIDELFFFRQAGVPTERILESATSIPRKRWHCPSADITAGNRADILLLEGSPFDDFENIRRTRGLLAGDRIRPAAGASAVAMPEPVDQAISLSAFPC